LLVVFFGTIEVYGKNILRNLPLFARVLKVYKCFWRISVYIFLSGVFV